MKLILLISLIFFLGCEKVSNTASAPLQTGLIESQEQPVEEQKFMYICPMPNGNVDRRIVNASDIKVDMHMCTVIPLKKVTGAELSQINAEHKAAFKEFAQ